MTRTCPVCGGAEKTSRICERDWHTIARDLRSVPALLAELEVAAAKQAKLTPAGKGGLASERDPIGWGAVRAATNLENTLTTWALDVDGRRLPVRAAALTLIAHQPEIRSHPAASELADDIWRAVDQARRAIDLPQHRTIAPLGPCPEDICTGTVRAYLPAGNDAAPYAQCDQSPDHRWDSTQFNRLSVRIERARDGAA